MTIAADTIGCRPECRDRCVATSGVRRLARGASAEVAERVGGRKITRRITWDVNKLLLRPARSPAAE